MAYTRKIFTIICLMAGFSSCADDFQGEYTDPNTREIIDDKFNEADAKKVAETMVKKIVSRSWLERYKAQNNGQRPVVIVDDIENRTDEHIDWKALTEDIQNELINSGRVRFLNAAKRKKILDELKYQNSGEVSKETATKRGNQTGADYFLGGAITSNVHTQGGVKTVRYQVTLTLTELETSEIVFSGKEEIRKKFRRSGSGW